MKFFRSIKMDAHAKMIARSFLQLRKEQFDCSLNNVRQVLGYRIEAKRQTLSGEADLALTGLQLWILSKNMPRYIPNNELELFLGLVSVAGWGSKVQEVATYTLRFDEEPLNVGHHLAQVTISIGNYLLAGAPDPVAWRVIEFPMPFFYVGSQLALAKEFDDKDEIVNLAKQIDQLRTATKLSP
jgi:hypothetical protein